MKNGERLFMYAKELSGKSILTHIISLIRIGVPLTRYDWFVQRRMVVIATNRGENTKMLEHNTHRNYRYQKRQDNT